MKPKLKDLWIAETIRLIENQAGIFADSDANRKSQALKGSTQQRILFRSYLLAVQHNILSVQKKWVTSANFALLLLALIAIFTGAGLAFTALSTRPVNIFWAISCLLGLHFITLLIWLFGLFFTTSDTSNILGKLWLWLTEKFSKEAKKMQLVPAIINVLNQQKALRWMIGMLVNGLWSLILLSALVVLFLLLSLNHYSFVWQTTLLKPDIFLDITHFLGLLPSWLGFPVPDIEMIRQSGQSALDDNNVRYAWAVWLIGVFICYGLLLRVFFFLFCFIRWTLACRNLQFDDSFPEYQLLTQRLQPSHEETGIIDADAAINFETIMSNNLSLAQGNAIVGIELDSAPGITLAAVTQNLGVIADRHQRKSVLQILQKQPVNKLLIMCDIHRTPDRGIVFLVKELASCAQETRIFLVNQGEYLPYWQTTLQQIAIKEGDVSWLEDDNE